MGAAAFRSDAVLPALADSLRDEAAWAQWLWNLERMCPPPADVATVMGAYARYREERQDASARDGTREEGG